MLFAVGCGSGAAPSPGATLFSQACSACHTLSGSHRASQGGDLLDLRASRVAMVQFTREMPVRHRLGAAQLRTVVNYVLVVEGRARRHRR